MDTNEMTFDNYQSLAMVTANTALTRDDQIVNAALGLAGEAGEIADLIKKHYFQGHRLKESELIDELGDLLWYVALLCYYLNFPMSVPAVRNIHKLRERYPEGFSVEKSINRMEGK